jgi:hypothetical protein
MGENNSRPLTANPKLSERYFFCFGLLSQINKKNKNPHLSLNFTSFFDLLSHSLFRQLESLTKRAFGIRDLFH